MKKSKINLPHIKLLIARGLAGGQSQEQIAKVLGTSQPTISRIARQTDVLEMVQKEELRLLKIEASLLKKISKDPRFLDEFQKKIEKRMFSYIS